MTGIPNAAIGTVYLSDGTTAVTNGMALTSADLTGLLFRPVADANGAAGSFSYTVNDGNGGSDSQTVGLTVTPVNDAPIADADKTVTVAEDSSNSALGIAAPTDIDGDPLTITVTGIPNASIGTVYLSDGTTPVTNGMALTSVELTGLLFRPVADANGAAGSFSYTVNDGNGGSDSQTVTLAVTPVNDAPIADADKTVTVAEDSGTSALGIAAPTDVDGDPLTITVTGIPNASIGTVYLSDGTTAVTNGMALTSVELTGLLFRPVADANGAAGWFSYTVNDGNGGSDSQTVTLAVTPVNDAPIADADKTVTVAEDSGTSALGIAAPTDVDGDPLTITVTGIPNASIGTVYLSDGMTAVTNGMALTSVELTGLLFRPVADANGAAGSFSYTVNDGNGGSDSQTVDLAVTPVNDAPMADADKTVTVAEDSGSQRARHRRTHRRRRRSPHHHRDGYPERQHRHGLSLRRHDGGHQRHGAHLGGADGPAVPPRRRRQRRRRLVQLHRQRRQRRHRQPDRDPRRHPGQRCSDRRCRQDRDGRRRLRQPARSASPHPRTSTAIPSPSP